MKKPCGLHLGGGSLTMKFKINCEGRKVRVLVLPRDKWPDPPAITLAEAEEITAWVEESELGHRISYDMWQLNSNDAVTMFMLRYG